ncbi:11032_t:CDS:2, partial [Funneliformis geosporum]
QVLEEGDNFVVVIEKVAPGFDYKDFELISSKSLFEQFPQHLENLDEAYFCFEGTVKDGWDSLFIYRAKRKYYCLVNIFLAILRVLKLPLKLLVGLLRKRQKKRSELEE